MQITRSIDLMTSDAHHQRASRPARGIHPLYEDQVKRCDCDQDCTGGRRLPAVLSAFAVLAVLAASVSSPASPASRSPPSSPSLPSSPFSPPRRPRRPDGPRRPHRLRRPRRRRHPRQMDVNMGGG